MKKVLIIGAEVQPIPPVEGGAVEQLVDEIIKDNNKKQYMDLTVISPYTASAFKAGEKYKNTRFIFIRNKGIIRKTIDFIDLFSRRFFRNSTGIFYIHKALEYINDSYDMVIVENRPLFGPLIKKKYHGELCLHLHNDFINSNMQLNSKAAEAFDRIFVISNYLKKRVAETGCKEAEVLYDGIDLGLFDQKSSVSMPSTKDIIYAGRLVKEKGVIELVKAFLRIERTDTRLIIVGDYDHNDENTPEFRKELTELIKDNKRVIMKGYVPNNEIGDLYKTAYIGVVPSIVNEALSLTAIEMLASSLPVIASDAGGLPEVVDESCGIIAERNNLEDNLYRIMVYLLDNEEKRNSMSKNAKEKSGFFSIDKYIEEFKKIFLR